MQFTVGSHLIDVVFSSTSEGGDGMRSTTVFVHIVGTHRTVAVTTGHQR